MRHIVVLLFAMSVLYSCSSTSNEQAAISSETPEKDTLDTVEIDEQSIASMINESFPLLEQDSVFVNVKYPRDFKGKDEPPFLPDKLNAFFGQNHDCHSDPFYITGRIFLDDRFDLLIFQNPFECYAAEVDGFVYDKTTSSLMGEPINLAISFGDAGESIVSEAVIVCSKGVFVEAFVFSRNSFFDLDLEKYTEITFSFEHVTIKNGIEERKIGDESFSLFKLFQQRMQLN